VPQAPSHDVTNPAVLTLYVIGWPHTKLSLFVKQKRTTCVSAPLGSSVVDPFITTGDAQLPSVFCSW
jgi:hypothetical protein